MGKPGGRKKKNAGVGVDFKKVKRKVRSRSAGCGCCACAKLLACPLPRPLPCPSPPALFAAPAAHPPLLLAPRRCRQVGKKLPRAQNQTDTSFKSRAISLVSPAGFGLPVAGLPVAGTCSALPRLASHLRMAAPGGCRCHLACALSAPAT